MLPSRLYSEAQRHLCPCRAEVPFSEETPTPQGRQQHSPASKASGSLWPGILPWGRASSILYEGGYCPLLMTQSWGRAAAWYRQSRHLPDTLPHPFPLCWEGGGDRQADPHSCVQPAAIRSSLRQRPSQPGPSSPQSSGSPGRPLSTGMSGT